MKTVPLHGAKAAGRVALVDDEDYELVAQYRWHVQEKARRSSVNGPYAMANTHRPDGGPTTIKMHKLITGWPRTDHIDHDGLNNQRLNLRPATAPQNMQNRRPNGGTSSQFKGVAWVAADAQWHAQIGVCGEQVYLGAFDDECEAARAYDAAAMDAWGEYACLNLPGLPRYERPVRLCAECQAPISAERRASARYCSEACRTVANLRAQMPRRREANGWRKRRDSRF